MLLGFLHITKGKIKEMENRRESMSMSKFQNLSISKAETSYKHFKFQLIFEKRES